MTIYKGPYYYISHHEVLKAKPIPTPCRLIFNSSAKFQGHRLNDYCVKGPDVVNNLLGVLVRFREEKVGMVGDIQTMYHSVKIGELDQYTHHFLWREIGRKNDPDTYIMPAVSFGDKSAETIASQALSMTTESYGEEFPDAAIIILNKSYVDGIINSTCELESAKKLTAEITTILKSGGFEIKEWLVSGEKGIEESDKQSCFDGKRSKYQKVLGVLWNPEDDIFKFRVSLNFSPKK